MQRRALLGTLASAASLALAGCTGTEPGSTATTTRTPTPPTTTTSDGAATPPALRTLGVPATRSDCPLGDEGRAVCYPAQAGAALALTPASDELDLARDATTFTLANDTDHEYRANFYHWRLHKRVDGEWFYVAPRLWPEPLHSLPAGASHEWSFAVDNGDEPSAGMGSEDVRLAGLGGGEYAFSVRGWFPLADGDRFRVAVGARVRLRGGPVELTPTSGVTASRDGDTVVVTTGEEPTEDRPLTAFVVERREAPPNQPIRRRITEQLLRPQPPRGRPNPLRNTLPFFEDGVRTVRLEAPADESSPFGVDEPYYLGWHGDTYHVGTRPVG